MLKQFLKNTKGSLLPIIGLGLTTLVIAVGATIDITRQQMLQARLQQAADAAGLATAVSVNSTEDPSIQFNRYLNANLNGYMDANVSIKTIQRANNSFTIQVRASIPSSFMQIFKKPTLVATANSVITKTNILELALVLDNSLTMTSHMPSLRTAAHNLLDILFNNRNISPDIWVGIVPFSNAINITTSRAAWTSGSTAGWAGCVQAREANGRDMWDAPPSVELFPKFYRRTPPVAMDPAILAQTPPSQCRGIMFPLFNNRPILKNRVNNIQNNYGTILSVGALWGWNLLSPRWRGTWDGAMATNNLPRNYGDSKKVMLFMSDGIGLFNNSYNFAYGFAQEGRLNGITDPTAARAELDRRFQQVCTRMKARGIEIYVVMFNYSAHEVEGEAALKPCASSPAFFYKAENGAELIKAFENIARNLATARVAK